MSHAAASRADFAETELIALGRAVMRDEAGAVLAVADRLDGRFAQAVSCIEDCRCLLVTGVGKAGRIAQKLADTFCSTGTLSHFLHPSEAMHGDLGRVRAGDAVLAFSKSGETAELLQLLPTLEERRVPLIAVTSARTSSLGRGAHITIELGRLQEACPLGLAPTTSTTVMIAVGDALALAASRVKGFQRGDFARLHPGGSLGQHLRRVEECMRPLAECRVANDWHTVRQVLIEQGRPGRRVGAVMLCGRDGRLSGFLTDSDVARLLESGRDRALDGPALEVMTREPITIVAGAWMREAIERMQERHLSELPVVDSEGKPLGLIDRADLPCLAPALSEAELATDGTIQTGTMLDNAIQSSALQSAAPVAAAPAISIFREPGLPE